MEDLVEEIHETAIIKNNAHPLLKPEHYQYINQLPYIAAEANDPQTIEISSSSPQCPAKAILATFPKDNPTAKYLRLQYLDYTATLRLRIIPIKQVLRILDTNTQLSIGIASAALSVLQNDTCPKEAGTSAVGEYKLQADFASLRAGPSAGYASIQCEFKNRDFTDVERCPRTVCRRAIEKAKSHGLEFLLGFEVEVVFLSFDEAPGKYIVPAGFGRSRAWGSSRTFNHPRPLELVDDIHESLSVAGIDLEYFHSESASGQFEFVLPPLPPLQAIDTLIQARQSIVSVAQKHNLRASLFPKPFPAQAGTAAHVHISLVKSEIDEANPAERYQSFYAGLLSHLDSILALSYAQPASYDRLADSSWAGGTYVCWGSQNRETPLRQIDGSHWEIRVLDGLANPYFAIAAIISAGAQGVIENAKLTIGDCQDDPSHLTSEERLSLGIVKKLPKDLEHSLKALEKNDMLKEWLGNAFVERYLIVKRAEAKMLDEMSEDERREWIIERY